MVMATTTSCQDRVFYFCISTRVGYKRHSQRRLHAVNGCGKRTRKTSWHLKTFIIILPLGGIVHKEYNIILYIIILYIRILNVQGGRNITLHKNNGGI